MFSDLGLSPKVLSAVEATGYTKPTPIQAEAIPHALQKKDVLGLAQTGTGKTAGFVLPMLSLLEKGRARARMPRTLILEPTRELAAQVEESFDKYGKNHKLTVALLIGGVSFNEQSKKVDRGADVVIATPGRLLDHVERGKLLLQQIEILVVDEADRMLDIGFIPDIERICKLLPTSRQTLFFSATMPKEIVSLVDTFLRDPVRVEVSPPSSTADTVEQRFVATGTTPKEKRDSLRKLIRADDELSNGIIFVNRKRDIGTLFRSLERHGFSVGALHGDMDQRARMATLDAFKNNKITLLVASDVAARGLDLPKVSHVFNYDVPVNAEDYVHRIGRTGRAGRSGKAFTLSTKDDAKGVRSIEAMLKRSVEWLQEALADDAPAPEARPKRGRRRKEAKAAEPVAETPADAPEVTEASEAKAPERESAQRDGSPGEGREGRDGRRGGSRGEGREGRRGRRRHEADDGPQVPLEQTPYVPAFLLRSANLAPKAAPARKSRQSATAES